MLKQMSIEELKRLDAQLKELREISRGLLRLNMLRCNHGLSEYQEKHRAQLEERAQKIAMEMGFKAYFQGDPRGSAVYLVPSEWTEEEARAKYYPYGLAIY